ncbi:daxx-like protein [Arctopsyche grandis]|uniref:daxx-like protein n=1 Tax=Arctopsyche grandis TaxID=121162 RepID=UPI00406DA453
MYSRVVSLDSSDDEKEGSPLTITRTKPNNGSHSNVKININTSNTTITKIPIANNAIHPNHPNHPNQLNVRPHHTMHQRILKNDLHMNTRIPITYSHNTPKMKIESNSWPIQNFGVSQLAGTRIDMMSKNIPQFIKPPMFPRIPLNPYRTYKKPQPNSLQVMPIANRMPFRNRGIAQEPMMPIIVSTRSLCNKQPVKPPFFSSELTVTKVNRGKSLAKTTDITPQVTIRKKSQIVDAKDFFNMAKPITTINIDDDDEDSCNKSPAPMEVVEIEFESVSDDANVEPDSTMNSDTVDDINSPLSTHSSSEKENSEPASVQLKKVTIEEPVCKRPKLSHSTDSIVEIIKKEAELSVPTENSCNERLGEVVAAGEVVADEVAADDDADEAEIHSSFQNFLDLCLSLDDSDDMKKIVDKRLKHYYKSVDRTFTRSKEFRTLVEEKMVEINSTPQYLFIYVKEVADELKAHRTKSKPEKSKTVEEEAPSHSKAKSDDRKDATQSKIKRLERALYILNKKITKLDEKEVDYDEEDNSAYVLVDRYKARVVQVYEKLCKLKGECGLNKKHHSVNRVLSRLSLTNCDVPKVIESLKKISSKVTNWFPNFYEVLRCVQDCASKAGLHFTDIELHSKARQVFVEVGTALKNQRQCNEYQDLCLMFVNSEPDPADNDPALAAILNSNRQICKKKENDIINKFANIESCSKSVLADVNGKGDDKSKAPEDDESKAPEDEDSEDDVVIIDETEDAK